MTTPRSAPDWQYDQSLGPSDLYEMRVERLCAAYYAEVPRVIVAMEAALIIRAVYRSKLRALWFFLETVGLKGWAELSIFGVLALVLLVAFLWGMQ